MGDDDLLSFDKHFANRDRPQLVSKGLSQTLLNVLDGGSITVSVVRGAPAPTPSQVIVLNVLVKILTLSPTDRLVGTWKDGAPGGNVERRSAGRGR